MGFNLTAEKVKVYKKERTTNGKTWYAYSISVSSKDMQGNWSTGYLDANFKKDVQINNKAVINIKKAFPTASKYNDKVFVKWFIMEFEIVEPGEAPVTNNTDEIPFTDNGDDIIDATGFDEFDTPFN